MSSIIIGLLASTFAVVVLSMLFAYEERTGIRFLGRVRAYADILVLRFMRTTRSLLQFFGRDFIRQVFHYMFHKMLRFILQLLRRMELSLKNAIRVNKTLAKHVEEERETRSKLEEIAFHKAANALSEEEKREHKDKMLQGF